MLPRAGLGTESRVSYVDVLIGLKQQTCVFTQCIHVTTTFHTQPPYPKHRPQFCQALRNTLLIHAGYTIYLLVFAVRRRPPALEAPTSTAIVTFQQCPVVKQGNRYHAQFADLPGSSETVLRLHSNYNPELDSEATV